MLDNQVYAMTKGQTSPTTPDELPVDPLLDMLTFGTGFLAQGFVFNIPHLVDILEAAILYKGFSFVSIQSPCVSFGKPAWHSHLKNSGFYLKEGEPAQLPNGESWLHDPTNKDLARKLVEVALNKRPYYGIIYRGQEKEGYLERVKRITQKG
jgi:pyruvate/2-oxoacid:ferredoxin oxidoreductase beta subunit